MQTMIAQLGRDLHEEAFEWIRQWWRAWAAKDLAALERMVAPGYTEATATRRFRPMAVDQLMAEAAKCCDEVSISSWDVSEPATKLYERQVVVSYSFRLAGSRSGRAFEFTGRATDVLVREGDAFRLVAHHGSFDLATKP